MVYSLKGLDAPKQAAEIMSISPSFARHGASGLQQAIGQLERFAPLGIGLALFALPILFPLGIGRDYPNHLARVFIEHGLDGDSYLSGNYAVEWFVVPDLALDIFAAPLAGWVSPYIIGGVFNGLMLLLLFTATLALFRRGGGATGSAWPLLATVVLFNEALRWGFVNFLFGCGIALWILYFWLESEDWPKARRLAVFSLMQLGLFFAHLLGFMLSGYLILVLELVRFWQSREQPLATRCGVFVWHMLQFAIPLLLFGFVLFGQAGVGDDSTVYGDPGTKALALLSPTSGLTFQVAPLVLLGIFVLLYGVLRHRMATLDESLRPLLFAMLFLVVAMPSMLLGIWGLDFRYPFVALLLLISAVRLRPGLRGTRIASALAMVLALLSLGSASFEFYKVDHRQQQVRDAFASTEPGSALLVAGAYDPDCPGCFPAWINELHVGSLAAIERQMFVPLLFTATSFVAASPQRHDLDVPHGLPISRQNLIEGRDLPLPSRPQEHDPKHPYWHSWDENFDYLLWLRGSEETLDDIAGLERLESGEVFVLYRITKRSQGSAF